MDNKWNVEDWRPTGRTNDDRSSPQMKKDLQEVLADALFMKTYANTPQIFDKIEKTSKELIDQPYNAGIWVREMSESKLPALQYFGSKR